MKVNKPSNEQSPLDGRLQQNNNVLRADKYQLAFSYLGDNQFRGQYLWLSQIMLQPEVEYLSITFYQQQSNFNYKSPLNQKRKSVLKRIIELNPGQVKNVRLPKMEADKTIAIQIKTSEGTMVARLPLQLQTTKTPLYNNRNQLVGFLSYKLVEANIDDGQGYQEQIFEVEPQHEQTEKVENQQPQNIRQDQENEQQHYKEQKQQEINKLQTQIAAYFQQPKANQSVNSSNQFLPKQKAELSFGQNRYPKKSEFKLKPQEKINDRQENSKLDKHLLPKMILSALKKEQTKSPEPRVQVKPQNQIKQPTQEQKQIKEQKSLLVKLRQMQNKSMAEKEKMKQKERIKQQNRFKISKHHSPEDKKSQKSKESQEQPQSQLPGTPKVYKIPVQLISSKGYSHKDEPQSADYKKLSLNVPVDFAGRSYLQKHLKQSTPKNNQKLMADNLSSHFQSGRLGAEQNKLLRKPGFITSQKKSNEIRQHIRDYTITRKRQQKTKDIELELINYKKAQSQQKSVPSLLNNQKLKLKVSRNIVNITVNQQPKKRSLTKVLDQSYFPKINQNKQHTQTELPNPSQDHLLQKSQESITPHKVTTKNTSLKISNKSQNLQFKSQVSTPAEQQYSFDIIVSNLSVNLYNKAFGKKFLELTHTNQMFTTDSLHGSHLLWVNRGYLFKGLLSADFIQVSLKCQMDSYLKILGKTRIVVDQLLLNYKQSFYQTYLYSPMSELLAVIIIGYEIFNHLKLSPRLQTDNLPITLAKKKKKKVSNKLPSLVTEDNSRTSMQKSKYKKYKGGQNIRIGKGNRFNTEYTDDEPGPGYYKIVSDFDRHTVSRKQK